MRPLSFQILTQAAPFQPRPLAALFESYHLRHDVASAAFQKLPVLEGFPVELVPQAPRPNDSQLYAAIKQRCVLYIVCVFGGRALPKGFPVELVPQAPRPNDSQLYAAIKQR